MSGGPLHWFRKNQKILLVVSGVLLMIVFTVGGVLDSFFSGQGRNSVPVRQVASASFGTFTNRDMDDWAEGNRRVVEFTRELFNLAGSPDKAKAFPIPALNDSSIEARDRDILSRMAHAKFAEEKGVYIGEETMTDYFNMLCNNELGNQGKTIDQFARELQRGALSTVKTHLERELKAIYGQRLMVSGIAGGNITPLEMWEGQRRLRERFKIEYMPIEVAAPDSIDEEPSLEKMKELYEKGQDQPPNIAIGPGFKTPRRATIGYFAAQQESFLEAEKAKITDAEILTQYQEWVENEDPRVLVGGASGFPTGGAFTPQNNDPAPQKSDTNQSGQDKKSDDVAPGLNPPQNNDEPKNNESKGDSAKQPNVNQPENSQPEDKTDPDKQKQDAGDKQSSIQAGNFQLVSFVQDQPKKQDDANQGKSPAKTVKKADPAQSSNESSKSGQDSKAEQNPPAGADSQKKAATKQESAAPDSVPPKSVQDDKPKIKPLDDKIREEIREFLARPKAQEAQTKAEEAQAQAIEKVKQVITDYLSDYDYYAENPEEADFMEAPDFESIAKENGLEFKQFDQVDFRTLEKTDFGKANLVPTSNDRQPGTVAINVFFRTFLTSSTFEIKETQRTEAGKQYFFWVIDKTHREKVSFEEAKPAIIEYYKQTKAIEAAEAKAKQIAADIAASKKRLSAEFGDKVTTSKEFGWMETNSGLEDLVASNPQNAAQMRQFLSPRMGSISPEGDLDAEPIEGVNDAFMEKIFALETNETGFATTFNKDKVYVFQVTERTKQTPLQMEKFFTRFKFGLAGQATQVDQRREINKIISGETILDKYSVKWFGEPKNDE